MALSPNDNFSMPSINPGIMPSLFPAVNGIGKYCWACARAKSSLPNCSAIEALLVSNKSPFSKNNNYIEYSEVQSNLHPHKCTLENNNNFCTPSDQSVEDIDVHSSEKKRRSAANKSKVKILQEELKNSAIALQQSVQISYTLLNEVHRLDNVTTDLQYDKERLTERNYYLFSENEYLKAKLKEYEEQIKYK